MRKQTKLAVVLSAAALLVIGASMTAFAAKGWQKEGDDWFYYDSQGEMVTGAWKRSGNDYFYLSDDGPMARNQLVEDGDNTFFVDGNGVMVRDTWVRVDADDNDADLDVEYRWYYFGATGKAYKQSPSSDLKKRSIRGKKYAFDSDGKMLFGFVDDKGDMNTDEDAILQTDYYFGTNDDGAMYTGWLKYEQALDGTDYEDEDFFWFRYDPTTGKKVTDNYNKKISGKFYAFDANGVMKYGWQDGNASASIATKSKYFSSEDDGHLAKKTWIWAIPSEDMDIITKSSDNEDEEYRWFYVGSDGYTVKNQPKKINGKWYVFDEVGRMKIKLVFLDKESISADAAVEGTFNYTNKDAADLVGAGKKNVYFFSADEKKDGSMKTGSFKLEFNDDFYTMGFAKGGCGYQGVHSNKLYANGVLQAADPDFKYEIKQNLYRQPEDKADEYVVGTSGTIVKPGKYVKDADDNYYAVNKSWAIQKFPASEDAAKEAREFAKS